MRTFFHSYDELADMRLIFFILVSLLSASAQSESVSLRQSCLTGLKAYKSFYKEEALEAICDQVQVLDGCQSVNGAPIFHMDKLSQLEKPKKILVMSLIHGDETEAGSLGRYWMERMIKVSPRNSWRMIPVANPDGVKNKTRTNSRGVDLNRNFPTKDWQQDAMNFWEKEARKSERRFPGKAAGEEPEVKCVIKQIDDFQPDFVISIHTPLHVLDFDGPKLKKRPNYTYLPWKSLGNFPGSLGRYLWVERNVPVLTTELKNSLPETAGPFEQLQDLIGTLVKADMK